jgi:hypothetical protein
MDTLLFIASVLAVLAFFVHTFAGDREIHLLQPSDHTEEEVNLQEKWTMAPCGWHWISFDLLLASIVLALVNFTDYFEDSTAPLQFLSFYFFGLGTVWIFTILISRPFRGRFLKLGQWILLLLIGDLIYFV